MYLISMKVLTARPFTEVRQIALSWTWSITVGPEPAK